MKFKYLLAASAMGLSAAVVMPAPAAAQQITSGIEGKVTDESGMSIAGATVKVTDTRTGNTRTITTGQGGGFVAPNLVTGGPYTVSVSAGGFEGQTISGINITTQGNTTLTFSLSSGGGEIVVSAARVQLSQLAVGPGQAFTQEIIENAPSFGRDVRDIIRIDPRVSLDREDTTSGGDGQDHISCLGGNNRTNAFTVDGISQGDIYGLNGTGFASRSSTPIPYDAVREVQVQFAPFDVEYDQFTGCAINVITKSGSNEYHGSAFFEYSDNGMRGDTVEGQDVAPVESEKHWGVSLGGPIIKDRIFLFGAYSHQETGLAYDNGPVGAGYPNDSGGVTLDQFNTVSQILADQYGIDTGPLVTNLPYENDRYFVRGDINITDNQRLELTYQHLDEKTVKEDDYFSSGNGSTVTGLNNFYNSGTKSDYFSGRLYSNWTDNFSTEIRYSHSKVTDLQDPVGGGEAQTGNPIPRIIVGVEDGSDYGAVEAGPGQYRAANDLRTWIDQGSFIAKYNMGDHNFKIGGDFNRVKLFNLFVPNATGTLVFNSIDDLRNGILADGDETTGYASSINDGSSAGAWGNYSATGDVNDAAADFVRTVYSVFAQDDWQMDDQLSATLGVRMNWMKGDHPTANPLFEDRYGFANDTGFDAFGPIFLPRLAMTYDMDDFGAFGRPQLRGGFGMFTGGDPLVWFGNAFQNNGITYGQGTTNDPGCPAGPINVLSGGSFSGVPSCIAAGGQAQAAAGLADTQSIDPNIRWAKVMRANLGFESDLDFTETGFLSGWHVNLDYIYSHYIDPFNVVDLSQTPNITKGIDGYTVDGRPIYAAIDPTDPDAAGCGAQLTSASPVVWDNVTAPCFNRIGRDDEIMLTNSDGYDTQVASIFLSKQFDRGIFTEGGSVFLSLGYAYTDANDRRTLGSSQATSNYDGVAAFDRQNVAEARSLYASKNNITLSASFAEEFLSDLKTRLNMTFVARSGRPYSLTFAYTSGVFNDSSSGTDNSLIYVPAGLDDANISPDSNPDAVAALYNFTQSMKCAKGYAGMTIARNSCTNDWYFDLDLSLSQEIPGPMSALGFKDDKLKLFASMDNFLNFLDSDWNVQHRRNYNGFQTLNISGGVDGQGRYILDYDRGTTSPQETFDDDQFVNTSSSVWRLKIGISYDF